MGKKFNSSGNNKTLKKGEVTLRLVEEVYQGENRYKMVGRIKIAKSQSIIVSVPVDSNNRVFTWPGKGDHEGTIYGRGYATLIEYTSNGNGGKKSYNNSKNFNAD